MAGTIIHNESQQSGSGGTADQNGTDADKARIEAEAKAQREAEARETSEREAIAVAEREAREKAEREASEKAARETAAKTDKAKTGRAKANLAAGRNAQGNDPGDQSSGDTGRESSDTNKALDDGSPITRPNQQLVSPRDHGNLAKAGEPVVNIPPGSAPTSVDDATGQPHEAKVSEHKLVGFKRVGQG